MNNDPMERKVIKGFANQCGYTDMYPFEVVETRTPQKVLIRMMDSKMIKPAKLLGVGGFCAHFDNHTQEWECTSNEEYPIYAIRWSQAKKHWFDKHGNRYRMSDVAIKFYDNNF
jgi:hypothetical protein